MSAGSDPRWKADAVLIAVTAVWGSSFIVVKSALRQAPPLPFLFWRFAAAAVLIGLVMGKRSVVGRRLWRDGLVVGLLLAGGMAFQVLGQVETTASKAAFLTGLSVVLIPFVSYLRSRRLPSLENGIGFVLASFGFFLLTFPGAGESVNRGDLWMLGCGVVFAFYVVELSERSGRHDALVLTAIQIATVALVAGFLCLLLRSPLGSSLAAAAAQERPLPRTLSFVTSVLYLASIGTVGTFLGQTWAQRRMPATHAAILFALEPVFAALFAAWLLHERLGRRGMAGGLLVLAGILVSELRVGRLRNGI